MPGGLVIDLDQQRAPVRLWPGRSNRHDDWRARSRLSYQGVPVYEGARLIQIKRSGATTSSCTVRAVSICQN